MLRLSRGSISFLLTGDIMREAELALISRRAGLASTALKVAHHGSGTSTSAGFLAAVNPRLAVISAGEDNSFGHPDREVVKRLQGSLDPALLYRTDLQGDIDFRTDGERLWVETGSEATVAE